MRFVLLVCADQNVKVAPEDVAPIEDWLDRVEGQRLEGDRLRPISAAKVVRDRGRLVTDGPFAETKEQIAGYDLIDCADLDEAIEIAAAHPVARFGCIEVRPVWEPA
jgi:hypothetical protein